MSMRGRSGISSSPARQSGAALVALLALVVMVSSSVLLKRLNSGSPQDVAAAVRSSEALSEAKWALLGYALADDNRPGELPCPDVNNDGRLELGVDFGGGAACTSLRGWFPWSTLDTDDLRDGHGERLWYAVAGDFRAGNSAVPLNSETPGQLSVEHMAANGSSQGAESDVVAVIIAPGAWVEANTGARGAPFDASADAGAWLEQSNADGDLATYEMGHREVSNDVVLAITRRELMELVERRVLGEVARALETYRQAYGAYPWLSPFVDPRNDALQGTATTGSSGTTLVDSTKDLIALGVRVGDVVLRDDGVRGVIDSVSTNSVSVAALVGGDGSGFALNDGYGIGRFNGVDGFAEGQLAFHDPAPTADEPFRSGFAVSWNLPEVGDFDLDVTSGLTAEYGAALGRFAETNAIWGAPVEVTVDDGVCAWSLPFSINPVTQPDDYEAVHTVDCAGRTVSIPYFTGSAGVMSSDELHDPNVDFRDWGVVPGSIVENQSESPASSAIVKAVHEQYLELDSSLSGGTKNRFDPGDTYRIRVPSRTTEVRPNLFSIILGLLSIIFDPGQEFVDLGIEPGDVVYHVNDDEWGPIMTVSDHLLTVLGLDFGLFDTYYVAYDFVDTRQWSFVVREHGAGSSQPGNPDAFPKVRSVCSSTPCTRIGSTSAASATFLIDSSAIFADVHVGDVVRNVSDGSQGFVRSIPTSSTLEIEDMAGGLTNQFAAGDQYEIEITQAVAEAVQAEAALGNPALTVTVTDREASGGVVGSATVSLPSLGTPTGQVNVSGIRMDLESGTDFPSWIVDNLWHRFLYLAAVQDGSPTCLPGTDCFVVQGLSPEDNKLALVLSAGDQLATQDRTVGSACASGVPFLCDYFEDQNQDVLAPFAAAQVGSNFNDQVRIVATP